MSQKVAIIISLLLCTIIGVSVGIIYENIALNERYEAKLISIADNEITQHRFKINDDVFEINRINQSDYGLIWVNYTNP